ncbi:MAG: DUF4342 domain-containing protein [Clostridiaceae bacterium]
MIDIEKVDRVMASTGKGYEEVKQALIETDGDVEKAINKLLNIEPEKTTGKKSDKSVVDAIVDEIKKIWEKGNASTLLIEKNGETVVKLSLAVGTIGFVLATIPSIIGLGAAILTDYKIKIIMDNGDVVNVNDLALKNKDKQ